MICIKVRKLSILTINFTFWGVKQTKAHIIECEGKRRTFMFSVIDTNLWSSSREKKNERNVVEKASGTKPTRFPMHEIPTDN